MKRFYPHLLVMAVVALLPVSSCKKSARDVYAEAVEEWIGREILFPDSMMTVTGEMIARSTADFTIVSYYDSVGCTGCRMKLPFWNEFMNKVDSVRGDKSVDLIIVAATDSIRELKQLLRATGLSGIMVYDTYDRLNTLNVFPDNVDMQTFLLDRDKRVIALGNPLVNNGIERIYLSKIGEEIDMEDLPTDEGEVYEFDFGRIRTGEKVSHIFRLLNESRDTIKVREVITSCECTSGKVIPMIIPPGFEYELKAEFQDTISGEFFRTISILFENNKPDIQFELSGEIINPKK